MGRSSIFLTNYSGYSQKLSDVSSIELAVQGRIQRVLQRVLGTEVSQ